MQAEQAPQTVSVAVSVATAPASEVTAAPKTAESLAGLEALKPGTAFKGEVRKVVDFGAFIDIGVGRDGLAHISTLKRAGLDKTIRVGDVLDVVVRKVELADGRISLTVPGADESSKTALRDLPTGTIVTGHVVRLVDFGAFVDIGAQTDGLLHVSQLPSGHADHHADALKVGDEVQVRILEVDARKRRISLSMREPVKEAIGAQAPRAEAGPRAGRSEADESGRGQTAFEAAFEKARLNQRRRFRGAHA